MRKYAILLALLLTTVPAHAATVTLLVGNVRSAHGRVHVDLCTEAQFLTDDCRYKAEAAAMAGETTIVLRDVPPGRYAAQLFHDENGNSKVDRALFGIPREGVGFSNDAPIKLAPPRFADAAFMIGAEDRTIALRMRYFLGPSGPPAR